MIMIRALRSSSIVSLPPSGLPPSNSLHAALAGYQVATWVRAKINVDRARVSAPPPPASFLTRSIVPPTPDNPSEWHGILTDGFILIFK